MIQRFDHGNIVLDLGKIEAVFAASEQVFAMIIKFMIVRAYVTDVNKSKTNLKLIVSRAHPELVNKLFNFEVPEISEGTVEVKGIVREAGDRTKIAVYSSSGMVDSVGACVGMRGSRVKNIVNELRGEKN